MQDNIQAALRNDEKLETLNTATEEMNKAAGQFKTRSHMLARKMWWQQKKVGQPYGMGCLTISLYRHYAFL